MTETVAELLNSLGGYRSVAPRLGMEAKTLHGYLAVGLLPAKFYRALVQLRAEADMPPPPMSLFKFVSLKSSPGEGSIPQSERDAA